MIFKETKLRGAYIIEPELIQDERGFFARTWSQEEFASRGLNSKLVQCNSSFNKQRGTLRGMHYQIPPHEEAKLVRCTAGAIYDVIVDLRVDSPTWLKWIGVELIASTPLMVYIPEGFAHGFQTLEDDTEVFYQVSEYYHPELARGVRWDDPAFSINWPLSISVISERDRSYPFLDAAQKEL
ncbi:MAG TPA: dTDP-4-dehydrorhamnose 3,5-epimerase [Blastocatellia bacterium]|jgi:dTDP-4-dehydrorhamnose 3,5-epimerase|nr:dTDP-4-dehydrorhamnose 3,5-epimerase [Blastocatellia bacterium]